MAKRWVGAGGVRYRVIRSSGRLYEVHNRFWRQALSEGVEEHRSRLMDFDNSDVQMKLLVLI